MGHPFLDGNKRTGITAASVFLANNGRQLSVRKGMVEHFTLKIINDRLESAAIAQWLKKNSRKI